MESQDDKKPTILVVDDSPDNVTLLCSMLKGEYRVKVAISGERALSLAMSDAPPDLILLDIMMPDLDGYEVCRRLKQDPRTVHIPVIFLTAKAELAVREEGLALGAADYIVKPPSPPEVLEKIRNNIRRGGAP
jgi:putative two-component system response regulator